MNHQGKRAVVTGAASGIGRAMAIELARRGASVLIADVDQAGLDQTLSAIGDAGSAALCDVSRHDDVAALAMHAEKLWGGCDLAFANAGVIASSRFWKLAPAEFDRQFAVNVRGAWSVAACFTPLLAKQAEARFCFTGSEHSLGFQHDGVAAYTATKHAVLGLAEVLRAEAPPHVAVSIFCPGMVATALGDDQAGAADSRQRDFARRVQARGMSAAEAARAVIDGVLRGDFYIVTHAHALLAAERRIEEVRAAFAAQAPWTDDAERYRVDRVVAEVRAEIDAERGDPPRSGREIG